VHVEMENINGPHTEKWHPEARAGQRL
jgi:hypothetical protein